MGGCFGVGHQTVPEVLASFGLQTPPLEYSYGQVLPRGLLRVSSSPTSMLPRFRQAVQTTGCTKANSARVGSVRNHVTITFSAEVLCQMIGVIHRRQHMRRKGSQR